MSPNKEIFLFYFLYITRLLKETMEYFHPFIPLIGLYSMMIIKLYIQTSSSSFSLNKYIYLFI